MVKGNYRGVRGMRTNCQDWEPSLCTLETWLWDQLRLSNENQAIRTPLLSLIYDQIESPNIHVFKSNSAMNGDIPSPPHPQQCSKPEKTSRMDQWGKAGEGQISLETLSAQGSVPKCSVKTPWLPSSMSLRPSAHQTPLKPKTKSSLELAW